MNMLRISNRLTRFGFNRVQVSLPTVLPKLIGISTQYSSAIKCNPPLSASEPAIATKWQKWTTEEVQQLRQAVEQSTPPYPWQKIADHLQKGKSSKQCKDKWYLLQHRHWSEGEIAALCGAVAKIARNGQHNDDDLDWETIGKTLGRPVAICREKFEAIHKPSVVERILLPEPSSACSTKSVERLSGSVLRSEGEKVDRNIVADEVGHGKSANASRKPDGGVPGTTEVWSMDKVERLRQLVSLYTMPGAGDTDLSTISWTDIGKALDRQPSACKWKWRAILSKQANENKDALRFTPEEDAMILEHVREHGVDSKPILWTSLEEKLGRQHARDRWFVLLRGPDYMLYWTEDMDSDLAAVRMEVLGSKVKCAGDDGAGIADIMRSLGWQVTASQCSDRYRRVLKHRLNGCAIKVNWSKELVTSLMELRAKKHSWKEISAKLHANPNACKSKYEAETTKHLNRGRFSAEEDALIRRRIKEWGDPRNNVGVWVSLGKEMGRTDTAVRSRWFCKLSPLIRV